MVQWRLLLLCCTLLHTALHTAHALEGTYSINVCMNFALHGLSFERCAHRYICIRRIIRMHYRAIRGYYYIGVRKHHSLSHFFFN